MDKSSTITEQEVQLKDIAREAQELHPSDQDAAGNYYQSTLEEVLLPNVNPEVRDLVADLITDSRRVRISDVRHTDLRKIKRGYIEGPMARGSRAIKACAIGLLDWDVYGKKLRDYVGTDLIRVARHEQNRAVGIQKRARFFYEVGKVAGEQLVGAVIDEKKAEGILRQVEADQQK